MTAYLIADITVHDPDKFVGYVQGVTEFVAKHGGKYIARGGETTVAEGDWAPERVVLIEFPSRANAQAFLDDPGYAPVAAIRHEASTSRIVVVEGA